MVAADDIRISVTDDRNLPVGEAHRSALAEAIAETSAADRDYKANTAANAALAAESSPTS